MDDYVKVLLLPSHGLKSALRLCMLGVCKNASVDVSFQFAASFKLSCTSYTFVGFQGVDSKHIKLDKPPPLPPELEYGHGLDTILWKEFVSSHLVELAYISNCYSKKCLVTINDGLGGACLCVESIEAEAVLLGQPVSMVFPGVVGFKLQEKLLNAVITADLILTVSIFTNFLKLIGSGKESNYVETENEPAEHTYLLLVRNKQDSILRLLTKLVPEFCISLDEERAFMTTFEDKFLGANKNTWFQEETISVAVLRAIVGAANDRFGWKKYILDADFIFFVENMKWAPASWVIFLGKVQVDSQYKGDVDAIQYQQEGGNTHFMVTWIVIWTAYDYYTRAYCWIRDDDSLDLEDKVIFKGDGMLDRGCIYYKTNNGGWNCYFIF
uniref:Aconitase/3-isopropylmalate dehydratase large subunit alpha/beta/alpha domain-containing protein n=1 Tax=Kalanchoe fedtschenkoi TaxID=63787 RepID=A0A7N0T5S9_KALFE